MPRFSEVKPTLGASPRFLLAAVVTAMVAGVTLVVGRASAADAIWYPFAGYAASLFPSNPTAFQLTWPRVGAPIDFGPVWIAGAASVLLVFALGRRLGCSLQVAAAAALALSFSGSFWQWTSVDQPATYAVLYALGATGGLLLWRDTRRRLPLVVAAVCYGLAVAGHPAALGALPALLWVAGYGGLVPPVAIAAGAVAGATGLWLAIGAGASFDMWFAADAFASAGGRLGEVASTFVGDFGILGAAFLLIGGIRLGARSDRLVLLAGWAAGVGAWAVVWRTADWQGLLVLAFAPLWWIVAVGMEWVGTLGQTRAARFGIAGIIVLLPAMSLAAHFNTGARARSASVFTDQYLAHLAAAVPTDAVILVQGGLLGGRLGARARRQPGVPFTRIPQTPDAVVQALGESRSVIGLPRAQENLRALGFRFERVASAGVPMTVTELLETVPDGWIVAVAVGPRFFSWVLPDGGPTFGAIGGTQDLFGRSTSHYVLIGVKGRETALLERGENSEVELSVQSAESLGWNLRAPAALAVRSLNRRVVVEYRDRVVAASETGIALAVMTPSGNLEAVFDSDLSRRGSILVNPPALLPGLVTGREPCAVIRQGIWTDVSAVAAGASVGGLTEPSHDLTVYAAADHPLAPRHVLVRQPTEPALGVTAFDTGSTSGLSALRGRLREDGLDRLAPDLTDQAYVYRIHVPSPESRRQIALRLGGFATRAFARVSEGPDAVPLTLCAAMSAGVDRDVQLARDDLFVSGWGSLERTETDRFRWTSAPRAELLLPMDQPERATIVIDAHPMVGAGTTLELWVNETKFAPVVLEASQAEYRWNVPAESWRAGMNRVWIGVSRLDRPSDLDSRSTDDRLLGLAVRRISLLARQ